MKSFHSFRKVLCATFTLLSITVIGFAQQDIGSFNTSPVVYNQTVNYTTLRSKYSSNKAAVVNVKSNNGDQKGYVQQLSNSNASSMTCWARDINGNKKTVSKIVSDNSRVTIDYSSYPADTTIQYKLSCQNKNNYDIKIAGSWSPDES